MFLNVNFWWNCFNFIYFWYHDFSQQNWMELTFKFKKLTLVENNKTYPNFLQKLTLVFNSLGVTLIELKIEKFCPKYLLCSRNAWKWLQLWNIKSNILHFQKIHAFYHWFSITKSFNLLSKNKSNLDILNNIGCLVLLSSNKNNIYNIILINKDLNIYKIIINKINDYTIQKLNINHTFNSKFYGYVIYYILFILLYLKHKQKN